MSGRGEFGRGDQRKKKGRRGEGVGSLIGKQNLNSTVSEPVLVQKRKEKKRTARKETKKEGRSVGG